MSYLKGFQRDILPYIEHGRQSIAKHEFMDGINSTIALADFKKHIEQVRSGEATLDEFADAYGLRPGRVSAGWFYPTKPEDA
jgi:hypothetical protein